MPGTKDEGLLIEEVEAFAAAGQRLLANEPATFRRLLALMRALNANYQDELESDAVFASRMMEIRSGTPRGSA